MIKSSLIGVVLLLILLNILILIRLVHKLRLVILTYLVKKKSDYPSKPSKAINKIHRM